MPTSTTNHSTRQDPTSRSGWVATLVGHLENYLAQEVGRTEGFTVWKDKYNLHGNDILTTEITAKLRHSAVYVERT